MDTGYSLVASQSLVITDSGAHEVISDPPVSSLVMNACRKWAVRILGESKNAML